MKMFRMDDRYNLVVLFHTLMTNTSHLSFSDKLRNEMIMLHHRTLTGLCEWADNMNNTHACVPPPPTSNKPCCEQPGKEDTHLDSIIEEAIEKAVRLAFKKHIDDDVVKADLDAATHDASHTTPGVGLFENDDQYRNSSRGRLSWGPSKFGSMHIQLTN